MLNLNLLPPEAKADLIYALRIRAALALGGAVALAFAVGLLALLPTILRLRAALETSRAALARERAHQAELGGAASPQDVRTLNQLAALALRHTEGRTLISPGLLAVLRAAPAGVRLEVVRVRAGGKELAIEGFAPRRSLLLDYLRTLRQHPQVATLTTPVANLVREEDVKFSLLVTLK